MSIAISIWNCIYILWGFLFLHALRIERILLNFYDSNWEPWSTYKLLSRLILSLKKYNARDEKIIESPRNAIPVILSSINKCTIRLKYIIKKSKKKNQLCKNFDKKYYVTWASIANLLIWFIKIGSVLYIYIDCQNYYNT